MPLLRNMSGFSLYFENLRYNAFMSRQRKRVTERCTPKTQLWKIMRTEATRLAVAGQGSLDSTSVSSMLNALHSVTVPVGTISRWLRAAGHSARRGRPKIISLSRCGNKDVIIDDDVIIDNDAVKDTGSEGDGNAGTINKVVKQKGRN